MSSFQQWAKSYSGRFGFTVRPSGSFVILSKEGSKGETCFGVQGVMMQCGTGDQWERGHFPPLPDSLVVLHGVKILGNGDYEWCDYEIADLWTVYLRTETPHDQMQTFDIFYERDIVTRPDAETAAKDLALLHGVDWHKE